MRKSVLCLCLFIVFVSAGLAQAADAPAAVPLVVPHMSPLKAKAYVLMDYHTGKILAAKHPNESLAPASTTKLMTAYVVFQELKSGHITRATKFHVSKKAWHEGGSRMFLKLGSDVSVNNLLEGMLVPSGNDAAMTLAEGIGGSEKAFVARMNRCARQLGLHDTHYTDPNGLPQPGLHTSALDLAKLSRAIIRQFPDDYHRFFDLKSFTWNNIHQNNFNKLLWRDPSVDGLKPGYVSAVGYNLAASAKRDDMRLIGVVMGANEPKASSAANYINLARVTGSLLDYGFRFYSTHKLYDAGQSVIKASVAHGAKDKVDLGLRHTLYATVPRGQYSQLKASVELPGSIKAPIQKGQLIGHLVVKLGTRVVATTPLVAMTDDPRYSFW
ncbi:MAG: D-alanyl-D-alanine carboxypeptidase [Salinisphaera sp.]|jgi:D-alanyl-D-alanine carboxypeptidase (penicillin-binding protein 5/6)|nr:D-alanyl-D-alanine carboxypeptidase [Salinisphaera sp.]